jgi:tRNA threonylcarbamoyladenosine biosynthesis protein TsaE
VLGFNHFNDFFQFSLGKTKVTSSEDRLEIEIDRTNDERVVTIKAVGSRWAGVQL